MEKKKAKQVIFYKKNPWTTYFILSYHSKNKDHERILPFMVVHSKRKDHEQRIL